MKQIKFYAFLLVALVASLSFTACGDDDNDDPKLPGDSLLGTWEHSEFDEEIGEYTATLTFLKNGSGIVKGESAESPEDNFTHSFKWSLKGDINEGATLTIEGLNADGDENVISSYNASIVDNILFLSDEAGETTSWEKKK